MTIPSPPDFSLFSRFVDRELGPEEDRTLRDYLRQNPEAQEQVVRIEQATRQINQALADASLWRHLQPRQFSPTCLSPEEIAAYLAHAVSRSEKERMDDHLRTCDPCLLEAIEARRVATVLEPGRLGPVPEAIQMQAKALWRPVLSRVVLRLVRRGLQQVTHSLTAPILNFELEPTGVMVRSSAAVPDHSPLTFRLDAEGASVRATTVAVRDGLALTLTLYTGQQEVLPGKRVRVQQEGMTVFSAKTDAQGQLHVPYLSPGVYELACLELRVVFQLELRSDPDNV